MKAFWAGVLAILVITIGAWAALGTIDLSSRDVYTSQHGSVRL